METYRIVLVVWSLSAIISLFHLLFSDLISEYKLVNRLDIFVAALGLRMYVKLFKYNWSQLLTRNYWLKEI
jgi:hypothetical protein